MYFDSAVVIDPDIEVTAGWGDYIDLNAVYPVNTSKLNRTRSS